MTGRISLRLLSVGLFLGAAGCASFYEIPIETPIAAKLDVSAFQRVFIAGFLAGGTEDVDGNVETVRLLRSQLRLKSNLKVVDADALPLLEVAANTGAEGQAAGPSAVETKEPPHPSSLKNEKDLEPYEHIFADADYWKKIGEEYQNPLIVTGTVVFTPHSQSGMVQREQEVIDALGRRRVEPVREYMERKGFILAEKFIFIDGRTGAQIPGGETFREERLYNQNDNTPALSSYFELMDDIIPRFLSTLSTQRVRGSRVLIK
ncbi:MAG TPA: hypothetical protein VL243_04005 [Vicinamibacterales bacterium]|nr:hypothetical protein [Vicinamibacterales bacterium]